MLTLQQYIRLSIVMAAPLLGLGYYLAENYKINSDVYTIVCDFDTESCTPNKAYDQESKDYAISNAYRKFSSPPAILEHFYFPLKVFVFDGYGKTNETTEVEFVNRRCELVKPIHEYGYNCENGISGIFEFVNPEHEKSYLKTYEASRSANKKISMNEKKNYYLVLFLPLLFYFLLSWLIKFIIYGFKDD